MRILLTTDTVGGVWTFTQELAGELLKREHSVALVSLGREPAAHHLEWASATAHVYGNRFLFHASTAPLEWMETNQSAWREGEAALRSALSHFDAELIHSNQFCFGALQTDLPIVLTAHSDVLSWAEACHPGGLADSLWLTQYLALVHQGLAQADALVAPTQWMANALERLYRPERQVRVVHNGRTLPPFDREAVRTFQAVAAGRLWDEAKGLQMLLTIDSALPVQIAGDLTLTNEERQFCPDPDHTCLLGPMSQPAVLDLFRDAAVYLAPSLYEPFGYAPLEAALCGCAIVARDLPSFREVWGEAALYFETAGELENLLQKLWDSEDAFTIARNRSVVHALKYSAERMADGYLALYAELLGEPQDRTRGEPATRVH